MSRVPCPSGCGRTTDPHRCPVCSSCREELPADLQQLLLDTEDQYGVDQLVRRYVRRRRRGRALARLRRAMMGS